MARYEIDNVAAPIDFQNTDSTKRVLQNAKNLLMCHMGEVPFDRLRGLDARLYDLPLRELNLELAPALDALMAYEPSVSVVSAEARLLPNSHPIIRVTLDVNE